MSVRKPMVSARMMVSPSRRAAASASGEPCGLRVPQPASAPRALRSRDRSPRRCSALEENDYIGDLLWVDQPPGMELHHLRRKCADDCLGATVSLNEVGQRCPACANRRQQVEIKHRLPVVVTQPAETDPRQADPGRGPPALLTRTSRPSKASITRSTASIGPSALDRSTGMCITSPRSSLSSGVLLREATATRAPSASELRAIAKPMPFEPPVTNAADRQDLDPRAPPCRTETVSRSTARSVEL